MARTVAGTRKLVERDFGTNIVFDGTDDYVSKTSQTAYQLVSYSFSFWVKAPRQADKRIYSEGRSTTTTPIYAIGSDTVGNSGLRLKMFIRTDANVTSLGSTFSSIVLDNQWHHVVLNDDNGVVTLYVDNVLDPITMNYTRGTLTLDLTGVGAVVRATPTSFLKGEVDKFRIFSRALTGSEVTALYYSDTIPSDLVLNYEFNEGSGTAVADSSGNAYNGTVVGGGTWATRTFPDRTARI